jgi:hypothetical protein
MVSSGGAAWVHRLPHPRLGRRFKGRAHVRCHVTTKLEAEGKDLNIADLPSAGYFATVPGGQGTEYGMPMPTLTLYSWFG